MLNIIADENLAYPIELFGQFGKVTLLNGRDILNPKLKNADVLIIRSVTQVNEALLKGTNIKFVGTATIGTDHLDTEYLSSRGITYASAPGCNSYAVAEYVITSLLFTAVKNDFSLKDKSIGIVGFGNVGSKVADFCESLGMKVLKNDPPLFRQGKLSDSLELNDLLSSDIITLHVPLTLEGKDKTFHLFDDDKLKDLKDGTVFINTARGDVVDNIALRKITKKKNLKLILDVWTNEPFIDRQLVNHSTIATPHIAGYTFEGKVNGSFIIYEALRKFLGKEKTIDLSLPKVNDNIIDLRYDSPMDRSIYEIVKNVYDVESDHKRLLEINLHSDVEIGSYFDKLRKDYPLRREFNNYIIRVNKTNADIKKILEKLRFTVINN